ncbi:MAG: hypothetical protein FWH26_00265 [Oscillospiraceae bacterium]|nr:hypothetical protein [Oscillospiraceae bacterium]
MTAFLMEHWMPLAGIGLGFVSLILSIVALARSGSGAPKRRKTYNSYF